MPWDDEAVARLKARRAEGASAAKIADELGVTRNAVCGKAKRLCLPPIGEAGRHERVRAFYAVREAKQTRIPVHNKPRGGHPWRPDNKRVAPQPVVPKGALHIVGQPLMRREAYACCYPVGESDTEGLLYCCAPTDKLYGYCPSHLEDRRRKGQPPPKAFARSLRRHV